MLNKRLTLKGTFKNWMFLFSSEKIGLEKCKNKVHPIFTNGCIVLTTYVT